MGRSNDEDEKALKTYGRDDRQSGCDFGRRTANEPRSDKRLDFVPAQPHVESEAQGEPN